MKALTIRQPWASLIAEGVKTIETRSWATKYRGRIAIHAGAMVPTAREANVLRHVFPNIATRPSATPVGAQPRLPLGAVVATAFLTDCVPMVHHDDNRTEPSVLALDCPHDGDLPHQLGGMWIFGPTVSTHGHPTRVEDQRPFGDFAPGRYAWLLDDIKPTRDRCPNPAHYGEDGSFGPTWGTCPLCADCLEDVAPVPAKGKQGLWNWEPGGEA